MESIHSLANCEFPQSHQIDKRDSRNHFFCALSALTKLQTIRIEGLIKNLTKICSFAESKSTTKEKELNKIIEILQ
jgi:hypothetical protein